MKRLALVAAFAVSLLALPVVAAEDFSGKWSGSFSGIGPNGQQSTETVLLTLVHKGKELTGTAGPSPERQFAVQNGKVDGNAVWFDIQASGDTQGPLLKFALNFADGHLKGDVNAEFNGQKLNAKADLARVK